MEQAEIYAAGGDDAPAPATVMVNGATVAIPVLTVADCRAWMQYMQALGGSGDVDLIGSSIMPTLTLDELYYLLPDLGDEELESLPVDQLLAIEAAVVGRNAGFIAFRRRIVRAGERFIQGAPAAAAVQAAA